MKTPKKPQNQIEEVFYFLLKRIQIDRRQMMLSCGVLNLPDAILKLRNIHGLTIDLEQVKVKNKFGREVTFGRYKLRNKKEASKIYERLQAKQFKLNLK